MRASHLSARSASPELPRASHDVVETTTETFNARDFDRFADMLADDVICRTPGGIVEKGKAAYVAFHRRWLEDFPDGHLEVRARHTIDHVVVEEGTFRGTHDGLAATGRSVCLDYVRVVEVNDGKQVFLNLTFDRLVMLEQLGLV